jgi:hypothetical protein
MGREISETIKDFNSTIGELLKNIESLLKTDVDKANIDRLRKRIGVVKSTIGVSEPLSLAHGFFLEYYDQIKSRDEDFFMSMDAKAEAKKHSKKKISSQDEFVFDLVDSIKKSYVSAADSERDILYSDVKKLLKCALEWKIYMNSSK